MSTLSCSDICEDIHYQLIDLGFPISDDHDHGDMMAALAECKLVRIDTPRPVPTQDELHHIFCNYWAVYDYESGDIYYLKENDCYDLREQGILHYDEMPPAQWGFEPQDRDKVIERIKDGTTTES